MGLWQLRYEHDSSTIRVLFEHDSATTHYEMRTIRVRFERDTTSYEEISRTLLPQSINWWSDGTTSGGFRGAESAPSPAAPLGDGPTPSRYAVMSASAKFWSSCCKTCTSEYSEWLSPCSGFLSFIESFRAYSAPQTRYGTCVDPPCMTTVKGLKVKRSNINVSYKVT